MAGFDEAYDKMMKRIEESGYYSSQPERKLERLLPRGKKPKPKPVRKEPLTDGDFEGLKEEYPYDTD